MVYCLLHGLSDDIIILLLNEWIDNLFDFDSALLNLELREKYVEFLKFVRYAPSVKIKSRQHSWKIFLSWKTRNGYNSLQLLSIVFEATACEDVIHFCNSSSLSKLPYLQHLELHNDIRDSRTNSPWISLQDILFNLTKLEILVLNNMHVKMKFDESPPVVTLLLRSLTLSSIFFARNEIKIGFKSLGNLCPHLTALSFPSPCLRLNLHDLCTIPSYFPALQSFTLQGYAGNEGLEDIVEYFIAHNTLETLTVGIETLNVLTIQCPRLLSCAIQICDFLDSTRIESLFQQLTKQITPCLNKFLFKECFWLQPITLQYLCTSCSTIQHLQFVDCTLLTMECMQIICNQMIQLESLTIQMSDVVKFYETFADEFLFMVCDGVVKKTLKALVLPTWEQFSSISLSRLCNSISLTHFSVTLFGFKKRDRGHEWLSNLLVCMQGSSSLTKESLQSLKISLNKNRDLLIIAEYIVLEFLSLSYFRLENLLLSRECIKNIWYACPKLRQFDYFPEYNADFPSL